MSVPSSIRAGAFFFFFSFSLSFSLSSFSFSFSFSFSSFSLSFPFLSFPFLSCVCVRAHVCFGGILKNGKDIKYTALAGDCGVMG